MSKHGGKIWNIRNLKKLRSLCLNNSISGGKITQPKSGSKGKYIFCNLFFLFGFTCTSKLFRLCIELRKIIISFTFSCTFSLLAPIQFLQLELCNKMLHATSLVLKNLICMQGRDVHCVSDGEGFFSQGGTRHILRNRIATD